MAFHSVSKYINGHTDVIMGAVMTNHDQFAEELGFLQNGGYDRSGVGMLGLCGCDVTMAGPCFYVETAQPRLVCKQIGCGNCLWYHYYPFLVMLVIVLVVYATDHDIFDWDDFVFVTKSGLNQTNQ